MTKRGKTLEQLLGAAIEAPAPAPQPTAPASVVALTVLVDPADRKRVRQLALDTERSIQSLGIEAWSLLLQQRGLPPLRQVTANVPSGRKRSSSDE